MTIRRVAVIFDNQARPETTGGYCLAALSNLTEAVHFLPHQVERLAAREFDLFVRIDDGIEFQLPSHLHPLAWWAIDTHLDLTRCLTQAQNAEFTFAAQRRGADEMRRVGVPAEWLPLACQPTIHTKHDCAKRWDFAFVGNVFAGPRQDLLQLLTQHFSRHFIGRAYFAEMAKIYSEARTIFNRSVRDDINMRVFEGLACGSLLLTNDLSDAGQNELFQDGIHLATYREPDEMLDKLAFYLRHPDVREKIATAGHQAATTKHTYQARMEYLLEFAQKRIKATAVVPDTPPAYDPSYFEFDRPELLAEIPRTAKDILDIGCGAGRLGQQVKQRQQARVVGIEFDPLAATKARERLDQVYEGDVEAASWAFPPQSFDAIVAGDVLEHLRDPFALLLRARPWLRDHGRLIISVPNVRHHSVLRGLLTGNWTYEPAGLLDRTHLRFFTRRELEKLLFRAGFVVQQLTSLPGPGYAEWIAEGRPNQVRIGELQIGPIPASEVEEFFTYQWLVVAEAAPQVEWGLTSIVIPVFNEVAYTRMCLESLRFVTDEPYEIIVVDNGSTDGTRDYLRALAAVEPRVRVLTNETNYGFPKAVNQGIRASQGKQVLLLNNDTILPTGWLHRLLTALHRDANVGLVGPCSNNVSGDQQIAVSYEDLAGIDGFAWDWSQAHAGETATTDRLIGFCLLIRREVVAQIGLLDEQFGLGCFEDDDYCLRARQAGYQTLIVRDAFVHHFGSRTFLGSGVDFAGLMRENQQRFRTKWTAASPPQALAPQQSAATGSNRANDFVLRDSTTKGLVLERPVNLSVCLIVRDNEHTIGPCLESIKPWVDEMIVVDTGSTDATPKIAEALGARIYRFPWCDDFSAARNESLRHARGQWLFWMDSDDTIDEENGRLLRALTQANHPPELMGFVAQVHCPGPPPYGKDNLTVVDHVKLIRKRPDLRFEGRIHEQILPAIRRAGGEVAWSDLFVVHSGYDHSPDGQERKIARDLRLLHLEFDDQPTHPFVLFNLGMTYADIGEYAKAADYLEQSICHATPGESHLRKAYALLAHCQLQSGKATIALVTCQRGRDLFPEDLELTFRQGVIFHEIGQLEEATAAYQRVLTSPRDRYFTSIDRGIAGYKTRQNLALVWTERGAHAEAEKEWRAVVAEIPGYAIGWRGLGEALLCQQKWSALEALAAELANHPQLVSELRFLEGKVARLQNDNVRARQKWEEASQLSPDDPEPLRELGRLHFEAGADSLAESTLLMLQQLTPNDPSVLHNLGSVQRRLGRLRDATEAFTRSVRLRPKAVDTRRCLAQTLQILGDYSAAKTEWRQVLAIDPLDQEAQRALAE